MPPEARAALASPSQRFAEASEGTLELNTATTGGLLARMMLPRG